MKGTRIFEANIDPERGDVDTDYLETIALLQDEVARLEGELLAREQNDAPSADTFEPLVNESNLGQPTPRDEIERLNADLNSREETINLLLEQLHLVEEAESASRLEWEQLTRWVTEVEERIEKQEGAGSAEIAHELETQRKLVADTRSQLDLERKTWTDQRRGLETEIDRLQTLLARAAQAAGPLGQDTTAIAILESENQRLKQLCREHEETVNTEARSLREALEAAHREFEQVRKERDSVQDERDRERREYEIAIAAVRSQTSRAALSAQDVDGLATRREATPPVSSALEADLRIREFRQHLKEIHSREAEARNRNRLGARLSRLWTRTGPKQT